MSDKTLPLHDQVDTHWEYIKDNIDDGREAFRVGWMAAMKWMSGAQDQLVGELEEEYDLELTPIDPS